MIKWADDDKYIADWEDIIKNVEKTDYPMEFVNSVTFTCDPESNSEFNQSVDIKALREMGYDDFLLKEILTETLQEFPDEEGYMEFKLDIAEIAKSAQMMTETYLRGVM